MDDDATLLTRWRAGDDAAGNQLVERHFRAVFRFFANKVQTEASDLTQQTFLALVERHDRLDPQIGFRAYALGVARHKLVHHLRGRYRDTNVFAPDRMSAMPSPADPGTSPTRRVAADERRAMVALALRSLPLDHQIALELHYWNEMSIAEIAAVLDCTPGSVKARLFRARRGLEDQVRELSSEPSANLVDLDAQLSSLGNETK